MSVSPNDLYLYGSANMPDADGATTGGAVSFAKKVVFTDVAGATTVDYVSSSASDTAVTLQAFGPDSTGVINSETKTLTGTTVVTGSQSFSHLLKGLAAGTTAVGDICIFSHTKVLTSRTAQAAANKATTVGPTITLQSGDGASCAVGQIIRILNNSPAGVNFQLRQIMSISGDVCSVNRDWGTVPTSASTYDVLNGMLFDLSPNQITECRRPFYNAASDVVGGSTKNYYEKCFWVNNNTTVALTVASILKQSDPGTGAYQIALTNALNDTSTVANRQTLPTVAITAFTAGSAPQSINVPSPQNLPSGAAPNTAGAQGMWMNLTLTAGLGPNYTSVADRATGQTA